MNQALPNNSVSLPSFARARWFAGDGGRNRYGDLQERVPPDASPSEGGISNGGTRPAIAGQVPNYCRDHHLSQSNCTLVAVFPPSLGWSNSRSPYHSTQVIALLNPDRHEWDAQHHGLSSRLCRATTEYTPIHCSARQTWRSAEQQIWKPALRHPSVTNNLPMTLNNPPRGWLSRDAHGSFTDVPSSLELYPPASSDH